MNDATANTANIVEVGPRDGLQNEPTTIASDDKLELIKRLAEAGCRRLEVTACVSAAKVPQMGDYPEILSRLPELNLPPETVLSALVANQRGLDAVLSANAATTSATGGGVNEIALFTAVSDAFTGHNINCTVEESLNRFAELADTAKAHKLRVRAYLSTIIQCPHTGDMTKPAAVAAIVKRLLAMGCDEISLGDTTGVGTPKTVAAVLAAVLEDTPADKLAVHFHDTYGAAIANVACALQFGIRTVDAAVGGLGGCPYAPGAGGNLASEDLVSFLDREDMKSGVNLAKMTAIGKWSCALLNRPYTAKAGLATTTIP